MSYARLDPTTVTGGYCYSGLEPGTYEHARGVTRTAALNGPRKCATLWFCLCAESLVGNRLVVADAWHVNMTSARCSGGPIKQRLLRVRAPAMYVLTIGRLRRQDPFIRLSHLRQAKERDRVSAGRAGPVGYRCRTWCLRRHRMTGSAALVRTLRCLSPAYHVLCTLQR